MKPAKPPRPINYDELLGNGEIADSSNMAIGEAASEPYTPAERWFITLCRQVLENDFDNIITCDSIQILRYEDMVGSVSGLTESISRILDIEVGNDFPGIEEYFERPVNVHAAERLSSREIFCRWPDKFRKMFSFSVLGVGYEKLEKAYAKYGYTFPPEFQPWLESVR